MPQHAPPPRDPRSIVTPDAFEVSRELLGLPLALPRTRLAALLIDLAVIGAITLLTKSFALILGVVVAVLFIREGFKRTPVRGSVFGRAMRLSVGCLGVWIGLITIVIWMAVGAGGNLGRIGRDAGERTRASAEGGTVSLEASGLAGLSALAGGLGDAISLAEAPTASEARDRAAGLARAARDAGMAPDTVRSLLRELAPDDAPWSSERDAIVEAALVEAFGESGRTGGEEQAGAAEAADSAAAGEGPSPEIPAFAEPLVADTLQALTERIERLRSDDEENRERISELRGELEAEREGGSFFSWIRDFVDELGFGFGWASLYLTVMLSWWKGQTVGKRIMKIRVVRLDGEPITWWTAFERAGGYAAGFATGLLGFAQVFWDANRQAIHDRIVGTVVVVDGAERVVDWHEAL